MKVELYRGLWKILNEQGRFVSWAEGSYRDAVDVALKCGCKDGEIIPCPEN